MSEYPRVPLIDVMEFREGPGILAKDFHEDGTPLIRLAGLKSSASLLTGCNFLDPALVAARWSQFKLREGDTLLSTSASLGEVARVSAEGVGAVPYTGIISFRPRNERILGEFVPLALTEVGFKAQIEAMGVGSVMKHFGPSHLRQMTVALPPPSVQRAIAEVLGALDDKIAANTKLAATAWSLARAQYRATRQSENSPVRLGDGLSLEYGKALPTAKRVESGDISVVGSGGVGGRHNDALVSQSGVVVGRKGTAGSVHWVDGPHWPIDTTYFVRPLLPSISQAFAYFWLSDLKLDEMNGDSAVPGLNRSEALAIRTTIPSVDAIDRFTRTAQPLIELASQCTRESETLAAIRDALFPQLMSGKFRVRDFEGQGIDRAD